MAETMVERRALEMWQEREMRFPERVRRMKPDHFDRVSGAWDHMLEKARATLSPADRPT
jgi:hypothetical protein